MRHGGGAAVLFLHMIGEAHAAAGHDAQGAHVVLFAVLQQDLAAQADAQQGLAFGHGTAQHAVQTGGGQGLHGLPGGAHTGKDDALGLLQFRRIGGDAAGDAQMFQRAAHAGLVACLVFENGEHEEILCCTVMGKPEIYAFRPAQAMCPRGTRCVTGPQPRPCGAGGPPHSPIYHYFI